MECKRSFRRRGGLPAVLALVVGAALLAPTLSFAEVETYNIDPDLGVDKTDSPTNHGPYGKTSDRYGVLGFPTYVLIDANSRVHYVGGDIPRRQEIEDLLDSGESTGP